MKKDNRTLRWFFSCDLHAFREKTGLSLRQVAKQAGISPSYLSYLERGIQGPPSIKVTKKLAEVLDVDPDRLLASAGHVDPDVTDLIKKNPDVLPSAIRKSSKAMSSEIVGIALIFFLLLLGNRKEDTEELTPETLYEKLKEDYLESDDEGKKETDELLSVVAKVVDLWREDEETNDI